MRVGRRQVWNVIKYCRNASRLASNACLLGLFRFLCLALDFLTGGNFVGFLWRVPVNGLAGRADLWFAGTAGKPCLAAALAFAQCDHVHVAYLSAGVGSCRCPRNG